MADDFYITAARKKALEIDATISQITTNLMRARSENNEEAAAEYISELAEVRAHRRRLDNEVAEYHRASMPPPPPPQNAWMNKKHEQMTHEDVYQMLRETSVHGKSLTRDEYNAGYNQLMQAKSRGDYKGKP